MLRWTVGDLFEWAVSYFYEFGIDSPILDAEVLLSNLICVKKLDLYLQFDQCLSDEEVRFFGYMVKRRINNEPIAYIIGMKEFWSLNFEVNNHVLIPRPETECLVRSTISFLNSRREIPLKILDMGTGSGAIILAIVNEVKNHSFYAFDISYEAVKIAKKNARIHGLIDDVVFFCGDWKNLFNLNFVLFDVVVANPPYIRSYDLDYLRPEVRLYEPIKALDGGFDGVECFRWIIYNSITFLKPGGNLLFEVGDGQLGIVKKIAVTSGQYSNFKTFEDYYGIERVLKMTRIS